MYFSKRLEDIESAVIACQQAATMVTELPPGGDAVSRSMDDLILDLQASQCLLLICDDISKVVYRMHQGFVIEDRRYVSCMMRVSLFWP